MKRIGLRKFTDQLIIALAFTVLLIIILLIFHINMYMQLSKQLIVPLKQDKNSQSQVTLRKNVFIEDSYSDSKKAESSDSIIFDKSGRAAWKSIDTNSIDTFQDLHDAVERVEDDRSSRYSSDSSTLFKIRPSPTLGELLKMKITDKTTSLEMFHMQITANEMYPENSTVIQQLLNDMANLPLRKVDEMSGGTQFKLIITYNNEMNALFKPKRCERDDEHPPNQIYYAEFERHTSEIAAFHVDRLLGFRRALPVTGRYLNIITQIKQIGGEELRKTFFKSLEPDSNTCFTGNCEQYCDDYHPICAKGDQLEGSFMAFLPPQDLTERKTHYHPYKRSYSPRTIEEWRSNPNYCESVKRMYPLQYGRHMLDFMDTAILDFLIGNRDRHNFQTFGIFNQSFHMHYDHGRSFSTSFDDFSILTPLIQCCLIRASTLNTLLRYHHGPKSLSSAMREALANDPLSPVLSERNLAALDRRIEEILKAVRTCITKNSIKSVIKCGK